VRRACHPGEVPGAAGNKSLKLSMRRNSTSAVAREGTGDTEYSINHAPLASSLRVSRNTRGDRDTDIALAVVQPWGSFCNDSEGTSPEGLFGKEFPHPRAYGTFPRVLRKYVREERRMRLEEVIRKSTSLPASRLRLNDRGVLKTGLWADIVVFDPEQITDKATFTAPKQLSVGMQWVLVNGVPVIADGVSTSALPGRVLRGQGYQATR
jgi:N-acyl-D-amino-acid deacylase